MEEATVKFKEISNAYETLSDPEAREWLVHSERRTHTATNRERMKKRDTHPARHTERLATVHRLAEVRGADCRLVHRYDEPEGDIDFELYKEEGCYEGFEV